MEFDAVLLPRRRARMLEQKLWHQRTINDALDACVATHPDKLALTALRVESGERTQFTYRELARMADRIAIGLARLGVRSGDVVACQLPNWWQFTLIYLACSRIGAVMNPLMHIFRERELSFMLGHGEAKVFIVPRQFRGHDFESMANGLRAQLPLLEHIVVVDGQGENSFDALLCAPSWEHDPDAKAILTRSRPTPDDVTQLIYTSGTTGEPKGVQHTANTLMANIVPYAERLHLGADDVVLMASPMAHQTGFMYGLMMPIVLQASAVLQDIWDPQKAIAQIREQGVTFTMASTPFLTDLSKAVAADGGGIPSLRTFLSAGAPIPGALVEQARAALGAKIISAWGMTENGAVTTTLPEDDDQRSVQTDGHPLPGVEIRITDIDGSALPADHEGKLMLRSCSNFGGYLKRPHLNATDADDWFDTGDLARVDANGYIRITGRSKDVIIRGGENIPVVEIESLLYRHPDIQHAAIVAYADERLGERACAVVVPREGATLSLEGLRAFLQKERVALQYIPERLHILAQMPATPSGKIQKFKLRELIQSRDAA
ncbi:cyclohexanecarboxylate-CoA ligase [Diaphorobacter sp. HDW4A]|uniref:cyclohexanecarboxylate-CoA ligase n=1 Tax=Diaphorobacter sp. HDW4A TaxID=2714924 RepID=UPI00140B4E43|nr:cyclohexanecarboxylate-CoA ligase [Diaphorobacter sp. HDW4A]QIL82799.1 cyclohexanecarboxylate-CoA ligase [Diaphorobacter sp. HDW4A]